MLKLGSTVHSMCCRGEPWVFTAERAYDINKAEGSCQTMMKRARMMIVSVMPPKAHLKVERTQQKPTNGSSKRPRLSEPENRSEPTTRYDID